MADLSANWKHALQVAALSDVGMRRANNQDSFGVVLAGDEVQWYQRGHFFMVADGMGAHAAGELASKLAVDNIPHTYFKLLETPPPAALQKTIVDANAHIHGRGADNADFHGMGTTCSTLVLLPQGALVGHVGDSRVYRLRGSKFEQLTFDHSLVWEMMASSQVAEEAVPAYVPKNVITRSLGPNSQVKVDLEGPLPIEIGDTYLLCSDGLSGQLTDCEMGAILSALTPNDAVQALVDLANLRGGPDNITVIVARVTGPMSNNPALQTEAARTSGGQVHPALWVTIGVCLLAALVFMATGTGFLPIALCVIGGLLAGAVALSQKVDGQPNSDSWNLGPLGKGPYRSYDCRPNGEIVSKLSETVEKLQSAAQNDNWSIDWANFQTLRDAAHAAASKENFAQAISLHAQAIRFVITQLRRK